MVSRKAPATRLDCVSRISAAKSNSTWRRPLFCAHCSALAASFGGDGHEDLLVVEAEIGRFHGDGQLHHGSLGAHGVFQLALAIFRGVDAEILGRVVTLRGSECALRARRQASRECCATGRRARRWCCSSRAGSSRRYRPAPNGRPGRDRRDRRSCARRYRRPEWPEFRANPAATGFAGRRPLR